MYYCGEELVYKSYKKRIRFTIYFLNECLEREDSGWDAVIFLSHYIEEKDLDSALKDVGTLIEKYGQNNVLLVIDGLHRRETTKSYVRKSHKLFEETSRYGCKLIATLRDGEKEILKSEFENLDDWEWNSDQWDRFESTIEEIRVKYESEELERILVNYLNYHKDKIRLQDISFDDMNNFYSGKENPLEKEEQYKTLKDCMESVVEKSGGLAGYIAFSIEDISKRYGVFAKEIVEKYPTGMVNLILNTIWRDYHVNRDKLIPFWIILLTKLTDPNRRPTKHLLDSFKTWGIEVLDKELEKEKKEEIFEKIDNFVEFHTIHSTFVDEVEYSLSNHWIDAIDEAIHKRKYDKRYKNIVKEFTDVEKDFEYLIRMYISDNINKLENHSEEFYSGDCPYPKTFYFVGDMAKLWGMTDINSLDYPTAFFKEYRQLYEVSLHSQIDFLRKTLPFFWRKEAEKVKKLSYERAIEAYKEAIYIGRKFLFSWNDVPGNDDNRLKRFLTEDCAIDWVEGAEIHKSGDGKTICIDKDENSARMMIDEKEEEVALKLSDGRIYYLMVKKENGRPNIYDSDDYRSHWGIGECCEGLGENMQAIEWYIKSANKQNTPKGYGSLITKVKEYRMEHRLPYDIELKYLKIQENAASNAIGCDVGDNRSWGMLADTLRSKGHIRRGKGQHQEAIGIFEKSIEAYERELKTLKHSTRLQKVYRAIGDCYKQLAIMYRRLQNHEKAKNCLEKAIKNFKLRAENENTNRGYLRLANVMSQEGFYLGDTHACEMALEKIDINDLCGEDLVYYYLAHGKDSKNKKKFEDALENFLEAKRLIFTKYLDAVNISVLDDEEDMHELIDDVYQDIGECYEGMGDHEKAAENYMVYLDLNEYTQKGESGKLYGIYGNKFLGLKLYKEAQRCFWKSLKRDPSIAKNLSQIAVANARLGRLEEAISNLDKALYIRSSHKDKYYYEDEENLYTYKKRLNERKDISLIFEFICDIADSAIEGAEREDLSERWYQVARLFEKIDYMELGGAGDLIPSSLAQSIKLDRNNRAAKLTMEELIDATPDEIKNRFSIRYQNHILEIIHNIHAMTIDTLHRIYMMKVDALNSNKRYQMKRNLSIGWGKIGWRINEINGEDMIRIPHSVAERCFELSVKLYPNNSGSWHNLGWVRYYIGLYTGTNSYYSKARDAFFKCIEIEDTGTKGTNHIPLSKIGIGKTYEGDGDAASAATWFNDSSKTLIELHGESNKTVESLMKTAERLEHLRFLDVSNDETIEFMKDALEIYEKASKMAQSINPTDAQTLLLYEKIRLLGKQIRRVKNCQEVETVAPQVEVLTPKTSSDKIFSPKSKIGKLKDVISQVSKNPDDYDLFKRVFKEEFDYEIRSRKYPLTSELDKLVSISLKQASKESPFEISANIFQSCQKLCGELYGEYHKKKFLALFNNNAISRFRKIVFGDKYGIGPIKSEEELIHILNKYGKTFGKLGARIPNLEEIGNECKHNKKYSKHKERVERIFG